MTALLSFIFFSLALGVVVLMVVQWVRGTHDLLCLRNFFLIGFVIFQLVSGGLSMATVSFGDVVVHHPARTGTVFLLATLVFLPLFLWSYNRGWFVRKRAWQSTFPFPAFNTSTLLTLGWMFLILGIVFRVAIGRFVPIVGILTDLLGLGILAAAAGLAMWAWAPRLWNPAVAIPAVVIILGSIGSTIVLTFGRRDVLTVIVTVLFAAYQSHWRYQGYLRLTYRFAFLLVLGVTFLAAFSTVRGTTAKRTDFGEFIQQMSEADISGGLLAMATGQYAAANSMWVIENYPDPLPYFHLHSVMYTVINPIPRVVWPDKPMGLGYTMVRDARVWRYEEAFTLGPGIIGHIFHDNPWIALVMYPILLGLLLRFFDEFVRVRPSNPFVVLPVMVGTGEIIGVPRGEVGLFLFRALTSMFAAWVAMRLCAGFLRAVRGTQPASEELQGDPHADGYEGDTEYPSETPDMAAVAPAEASGERNWG